MIPLFVTLVGSHMWSQATEYSDVDMFACYSADPYDVLTGKIPSGKRFVQLPRLDYGLHEAGFVAGQLARGNINYLMAVTSPSVILTSHWHESLVAICKSKSSATKSVYWPVRGLITHNYKKYIGGSDSPLEKKIRTIMRFAKFGTSLLTRWDFDFSPPPEPYTRERLERLISQLDEAYRECSFPEMDPALTSPYRNWLYNTRMDLLPHSIRSTVGDRTPDEL